MPVTDHRQPKTFSRPEPDDLIPLARVLAASVAALGLTEPTADLASRLAYLRLWRAKTACRFPTVRIGGRDFVERRHLSAVHRAMGVQPTPASATAA